MHQEHRTWADVVIVAAGWIVAHLDLPDVVQLLTAAVLIVRLALGVREWLRGGGDKR